MFDTLKQNIAATVEECHQTHLNHVSTELIECSNVCLGLLHMQPVVNESLGQICGLFCPEDCPRSSAM